MKDYFSQLANFAIQEGLPAQRGARTWRSAEFLQRNAELAIWAVINASALAIGALDPSSARVRIDWASDQAFSNLLDRLGSRRKSEIVFMDDNDELRVIPQFNIKVCLAYIEAPGADLSETSLRNADFRHANLRQANLVYADLNSSDVADADFEGARLFWAILDNVDFRNARVDKCEMAFASLSGTSFATRQLSQIAFTPLSLAAKLDLDLSKVRIEQRYDPPGRGIVQAIEILEQLLSRLKRESIDQQTMEPTNTASLRRRKS